MWLNAKCACKAAPVLMDLLNLTMRHQAASSKTIYHIKPRVEGPLLPLCARFPGKQGNCVVNEGRGSCFEEAKSKFSVWGMDGWQLLIILSITFPLWLRWARYFFTFSSSPNIEPSQLDRGSLRLFNYSPGWDDSRWLSSLERKREAEDQEQRGVMNKTGGGRMRK